MSEQQFHELLTPEEIAASQESDFLEDHDPGAEPATPATPPAEAGAEGAEAQAEADTAAVQVDPAPQPEPAPQASDPAAQAAPEPAPQAAEPEPAPQPQQRGPDPRALVDNLAPQIAAFETQRGELLDKFEDGDLTRDDLQTALDELNAQADPLKAQVAVAENAAAQDETSWNGAVGDYLTAHPGLKGSDEVLQAFDNAVRYVTGNDNFAHMSYEEQLARAHAQIEFEAEATGLKGVPPSAKANAPTPEPTPAPKAEAQKPQGPDMRTPPPTLAHAPASDISELKDSPFASLQSLIETGDSDAIEAAYSRLTPAQRDEFSSMDI